jgi:hypothetical protein
MKIGLLVVSLLLAFQGFAFAGSSGGSDMCGLGWSVTTKKSFLATTTRGTTNMIIPYTFGMTLGTMNCDQHSITQQEFDAAKYAVNNYDSLSIEMAQGEGENLMAFAETMGCSNPTAVGKFTQDNFGAISNAKNGLDMYENVRTLIRQDRNLKAACLNII